VVDEVGLIVAAALFVEFAILQRTTQLPVEYLQMEKKCIYIYIYIYTCIGEKIIGKREIRIISRIS
jgi:hypothetical protein